MGCKAEFEPSSAPKLSLDYHHHFWSPIHQKSTVHSLGLSFTICRMGNHISKGGCHWVKGENVGDISLSAQRCELSLPLLSSPVKGSSARGSCGTVETEPLWIPFFGHKQMNLGSDTSQINLVQWCKFSEMPSTSINRDKGLEAGRSRQGQVSCPSTAR